MAAAAPVAAWVRTPRCIVKEEDEACMRRHQMLYDGAFDRSI